MEDPGGAPGGAVPVGRGQRGNGRLHARTPFGPFQHGRFVPAPPALLPSVEQWLHRLPSADPKGRFRETHVRELFRKFDTHTTRPRRDPGALVEQIEAANLKDGLGALPAALKAAIHRQPLDQALGRADALALFAYTVELEEDHPEHQLYQELNRICRDLGQPADPAAEVLSDWQLFAPFAWHVNAAVQSLQTVPAVLYRGAKFDIERADYVGGRQGTWGGITSASSDRRQAARFIDKTVQLMATGGCYFMLLTCEARPIFHLSEFPEELEYLHPLEAELKGRGVSSCSLATPFPHSCITYCLATPPFYLNLLF